jgi:hypothetical protein
MNIATKNQVIYTRKGVRKKLFEALEALKDSKPNDRSKDDRRFAITITEMEKVIAYYSYYLACDDIEEP